MIEERAEVGEIMKTGVLVFVFALWHGTGAWGDSFDPNAVKGIEALVEKDPSKALKIIETQLRNIDNDTNAAFEKGNGLSVADKRDKEAALGQWTEYLTSLQANAKIRERTQKQAASASDKKPDLIIGAGITK